MIQFVESELVMPISVVNFTKSVKTIDLNLCVVYQENGVLKLIEIPKKAAL